MSNIKFFFKSPKNNNFFYNIKKMVRFGHILLHYNVFHMKERKMGVTRKITKPLNIYYICHNIDTVAKVTMF